MTKIIVNKYIPFHGYDACAIYGVIFWRSEYANRLYNKYKSIVNHEQIHFAQMRDFAFFLKCVPALQMFIGGTIFYIVYFLEWLYRLIVDYHTAYDNISFEQEAYKYENDYEYLEHRKIFSQWKQN